MTYGLPRYLTEAISKSRTGKVRARGGRPGVSSMSKINHVFYVFLCRRFGRHKTPDLHEVRGCEI